MAFNLGVIDGDDIEYEEMDAGKGLWKAILIGEDEGAENFVMRKFRLDPGGEVPRHRNKVEHEQYVVKGDYDVGIDGEEYRVKPGDSLFVPRGTPHWYRNRGNDYGEFICVVPMKEDELEILD